MAEGPFSLEKSLEEIRSIVEQMQQGGTDFDRQMALFGRGTELIKACQAYLDEAETRIQMLVDGRPEDFPEQEAD